MRQGVPSIQAIGIIKVHCAVNKILREGEINYSTNKVRFEGIIMMKEVNRRFLEIASCEPKITPKESTESISASKCDAENLETEK